MTRRNLMEEIKWYILEEIKWYTDQCRSQYYIRRDHLGEII